jgi:hypothetical protein
MSRCFFQRSVMGNTAEGQVNVGDDRAILHPGPTPTTGAPRNGIGLFDGDLARRPTERIGQDAYVFETDEVGDDLGRIDRHRGDVQFCEPEERDVLRAPSDCPSLRWIRRWWNVLS